MDANGQRFFLFADELHFSDLGAVGYDARKRRLRLVSMRCGPAPAAVADAVADDLLDRVPAALDPYGTYAYWSPDKKQPDEKQPDKKQPDEQRSDEKKNQKVFAAGALQEPENREHAGARRAAATEFHQLPSAPTDICLGDDGIVAFAVDGRVRFVDARDPDGLRTREDTDAKQFLDEVTHPEAKLWRIAAGRGAGFVAIDRDGSHIVRLTGTLPSRRPAPNVAVYTTEPPAPRAWTALPAIAFDDERPAALAIDPDGAVVVLSWSGGRSYLRMLPRDAGAWDERIELTAGVTPAEAREPKPATSPASKPVVSPAPQAFSLAFVGGDRLAVLVPGLFAAIGGRRVAEALVYAWPPPNKTRELLPLGDLYPLTRPGGGAITLDDAVPLYRGPTGEAGYGWRDGPGPRVLAPLSRRTTPSSGQASCCADSRAPGTVWHRIYVEAVVPPGTGVRLELAATDDANRVPTDADFFPHDLGVVPESAATAERAESVPHDLGLVPKPTPPREPPPRAAFVHASSELPFEPGFLGCPPEAPHTGLFTVLVQRSGRAVRTLAGRKLHVRVKLYGTGTHTPEIAAIRVYAPRFSYAEKYLPELYAETVFGPDADAPARATGADFLNRLLALVESELTPMEDRVAAAYLLTDPRKTPDEALAWLASWVGLALDPVLPADRRRALLQVAPELARWHGTLRGLTLALDAVTGGDVAAGRLVIVEDFRMRRVFATILGAHLEDDNDPLLPGGLITSGNSYVGDTLFLGEGDADDLAELAAFYRPDDDAAADRVIDLRGRLAHRVTVLVHDAFTPQRRALIDRAVALEAPAHVEVRVVAARWPLLVGVASLVGVDTYLTRARGLATFRLDQSPLGERDVVRRPPSLDPRLEGDLREETP